MSDSDHSAVSEAENTIIATDITVQYESVVALDHFSINIPNGIVGLLGPNGAGKSTFIKTVLGLVRPQYGDIMISGLDPRKDVMSIRDRVGYMPEHDCLIDSMSGVEMVAFLGRLSGMSKEDAIPRSHEVLDFVGLGEERYRPISTYSTGMKQRAKLAQAIVHDPEILFLDEPTNGMDPLGREEMLNLIGKIGASNKSILVSSHILQDMERICQHVIIINNGKAIIQGTMAALLDQGEDRKRLKIRGTPDSILKFMEHLRQKHEVITTSEEYGQMTIVLINREGSDVILNLARNYSIQVRAYLPDRITLEDAFLRLVKEAV